MNKFNSTLAALMAAFLLAGCVGAELSLVLKRDAVAPMTYQGCTTETLAEGGDEVITENCVTTWGDPFFIKDVTGDHATGVIGDLIPLVPFTTETKQ